MGVLCLHFLLNKFVFYLDFCLCFGVYPMKFATTRWRTMWAKRKSANARSGRMLSKLDAFTGLACILRLTPKMKLATQLMKPDRNALNGKVPTRQQWKQMEGNFKLFGKGHFFYETWVVGWFFEKQGFNKNNNYHTSVNKLNHTGDQNIEQISIHQLQFARGFFHIRSIQTWNRITERD